MVIFRDKGAYFRSFLKDSVEGKGLMSLSYE